MWSVLGCRTQMARVPDLGARDPHLRRWQAFEERRHLRPIGVVRAHPSMERHLRHVGRRGANHYLEQWVAAHPTLAAAIQHRAKSSPFRFSAQRGICHLFAARAALLSRPLRLWLLILGQRPVAWWAKQGFQSGVARWRPHHHAIG